MDQIGEITHETLARLKEMNKELKKKVNQNDTLINMLEKKLHQTNQTVTQSGSCTGNWHI